MKPLTPTIRRQLALQGFGYLPDTTLAAINPWLRLAPAMCMIGAAIGTYLASPWIIWSLMFFAGLGGILSHHPFEAIYTYGLRHVMGTPKLPPTPAPRRFGCRVATLWLGLTGGAFYAGALIAGYMLGGVFVLLPLVNVMTGFCMPSFAYRRLFKKPLVEEKGRV